ncbi:MAG: YchF/TatD family DNA exonuclease [Candidatus Omnitrophica bacterium]|nr:YchF/TatD family DNA exonuclease [Candidatus Omnitrophota bacterium]
MNSELMQLIDSHCHLNLGDFDKDLDRVLTNARNAGVVRIVVPGTNLETSAKAVSLASKYPEVFAAVGVHPHDADKVDVNVLNELKGMAKNSRKVVAIGEIGLDYFRNLSSPQNQRKIFDALLETAIEIRKPVILHNRNADNDFFEMLASKRGRGLTGVVHCFSGSPVFAEKVLDLGLCISFAGNITYPKAVELRESAAYVPIEQLLLETDAPYLSPEPKRTDRNEPANVKYLVKLYAEIHKLSEDDIARITTHNANKLFALGLNDEMALAYPIRDSLYLNITNECSNNCTFCARNASDYVKGHNLKLDHDPSAEELMKAMGDISMYSEVVFCGFGEPTCKLELLKTIAAYVKKQNKKVRLNTNGQGSHINGRNIVDELKGLVDAASISLNAPNAALYNEICRPASGRAYEGMLEFAKLCIASGIKVELTCLDNIGEDNVAACKAIAEKLGAGFRLRHFNRVG